MRHASCRVYPGECPAVRVKHRQRPKISVIWCQMMMNQCAHNIHVGVTMGNHDTFWSSRSSASIVDR